MSVPSGHACAQLFAKSLRASEHRESIVAVNSQLPRKASSASWIDLVGLTGPLPSRDGTVVRATLALAQERVPDEQIAQLFQVVLRDPLTRSNSGGRAKRILQALVQARASGEDIMVRGPARRRRVRAASRRRDRPPLTPRPNDAGGHRPRGGAGGLLDRRGGRADLAGYANPAPPAPRAAEHSAAVA